VHRPRKRVRPPCYGVRMGSRWQTIPNLSGQRGVQERAESDLISLNGKTLEEIEAIAIRACFQRNKGKIRHTAKELGLSRSTMHTKLDALGLRKTRVYLRVKP
jgi:transcriptional regulator of acetoin/glycerol metabolism